jgi:hypothetical protein
VNNAKELKDAINEILNVYTELANSFEKGLEETTKKTEKSMRELGLEDIGKGLSSIALLTIVRLKEVCYFLKEVIAQTNDPDIINWILANTIAGKEAFIDKEFELQCPFCNSRIPPLSFSIFSHFIKLCNVGKALNYFRRLSRGEANERK